MARNTYYRSPHWQALRKEALRRAGGRCSVPGCGAKGTHVDHIKTRPNSDLPTALDVNSNLRVLCAQHDAQIKERSSGKRSNGGVPKLVGCDASGWPLDTARGWPKK